MIEKINSYFLKNSLTPEESGQFLKHFHYFRGFAIINIVLVHILKYPGNSKTFVLFREVLFHGSTIYFLFIAGFLFYYLSSSFHINTYYKSKIKNVITPYIIITTVLLLIKYRGSSEAFNIILFSKDWIHSILTGDLQVQFWYLPFISIVFLISPILLLVPYRIRTIFFPIILIMPLLGTRTVTPIWIYQFIYFLPVYIIGMYTAMRYDKLVLLIKKYFNIIIFTSITSTIIILLFWKMGWKSRYGIINIIEGLFYLQKLSLTIIILKYLKSFENKNLKLLDELATFSFGIYFTHVLLNYFLHKLNLIEFVASYSEKSLVPFIVIYSIILILINLIILKIIKKIFKKKSRLLVGV